VNTRYGVTIPFSGRPLAQQREEYEEVASLGYSDLWSAETAGYDGLTPLTLASVWVPTMRLGVAILPVYTRGPALLASTVAAMAHAAPGRFALGVGTSSDVIVGRWNGIPFDKPYQRARDTLRFLKTALTGEKVTEEYETFSVRGFRLETPLRPEDMPSILLAALRPGMLRLAGREADGAIINWLSPADVRTVVGHVGEGKEIVARLFCVPSADTDTVRAQAKFAIAAYLNVPVYAAFHEWLGRGEALGPMWDAWRGGDRKGALEAIPDSVVDDLIIHGPPDQCRARIEEYVAAGVTTTALAVLPLAGVDARQALRDLSPR
jgi:probable F420-dependent oxidoreductase